MMMCHLDQIQQASRRPFDPICYWLATFTPILNRHCEKTSFHTLSILNPRHQNQLLFGVRDRIELHPS